VLELAARGHDVHLLADEVESTGGQGLVERLAAASPRISWGLAPAVAEEPWFPAVRKLRHALEYVRFLDPRYDGSPKLRLRTADRAPRVVRWLGGLPGARRTPLRRAVAATLRRLERSIPPAKADLAFLRAQAPDVLLLASATITRAPQLDHQKAARRLGIPVGACVMSWDHLSSKAPIHIVPDRVLVWNDVQRDEAVRLHGVPPDTVVVTGAQCYDRWFEAAPSRDRATLLRDLGLEPGRPLILYAASAMSPAPEPPEPAFVREWIRALRKGDDERLRRASVLVRPHPERAGEWAGFETEGLGPVAVRAGAAGGEGRAEYLDTLIHCDAVVGICTTVFLEAAIVGRPVLTVLHEPFRVHQSAMAHFNYLVEVEGGVLHVGRTLDEHVRQLRHALDAPDESAGRRARFLRAFVRPAGLDEAATPRFADAVEALGRQASRPESAPAEGRLLAPVARHLTSGPARGLTAWLLTDAIEARRQAYEIRSRHEKARARHRRARNPRKQLARFKTRVKRLLGLPVGDGR
jgi:hypothetical protein